MPTAKGLWHRRTKELKLSKKTKPHQRKYAAIPFWCIHTDDRIVAAVTELTFSREARGSNFPCRYARSCDRSNNAFPSRNISPITHLTFQIKFEVTDRKMTGHTALSSVSQLTCNTSYIQKLQIELKDQNAAQTGYVPSNPTTVMTQ